LITFELVTLDKFSRIIWSFPAPDNILRYWKRLGKINEISQHLTKFLLLLTMISKVYC